MCGIAGVVRFGGLQDEDRLAASRGLVRVSHRGPDGEGVHDDGIAVLGHRRLAIIDPAGGHQPIGNEDGSIWVTANCEIYNHRVLREELEAGGHRFQTGSDAEVLVHLYEAYGDCFVEKLRGMFAFALWDNRRRRLLLVRDAIGVKPLYFGSIGLGSCATEGVVFASRLDAVIEHREIPRRVDEAALHEYLTYHYVPSPRTILRDVCQLSPGERVVISAEGTSRTTYWDVSFAEESQRSEEAWCRRIRDGLSETVRTHLVSDVPVGAFLSGGLDSGAIVWNMVQVHGAGFDSFTAGFDDPEFDERIEAGALADRLGVHHHACMVRPEATHVVETISEVFDEPFADPSSIATHAVSGLASGMVKTVLSGDGGDELFGGYTRYIRRHRQRSVTNVLQRFGRIDGLRRLRELGGASQPWSSGLKRLSAALDGLSADDDFAHYLGMAWYHPWDTVSLLRPETVERLGDHDPYNVLRQHFAACDAQNPLGRGQYVDMKTWLADGVLCKVDRASMAHGLEVRVPLLDTHWVQSMAVLPASLKIRGGRGKYILREAIRSQLGEQVSSGRKKGFEAPMDEWFRGPLREMVQDILLSPDARIYEWLGADAVGRCWRTFVASKGSRLGARLWAMLMLELWLRRHIPATGGLASGSSQSGFTGKLKLETEEAVVAVEAVETVS